MKKILEKETKVSKHKKSGVIKIQDKDLQGHIGRTVRIEVFE